MTTSIRLLIGLVAGLGMWLFVLGWRGQRVFDSPPRAARLGAFTDQLLLRLVLFLAAGATTVLLTGWPLMALTTAVAAAAAPTWIRQRGRHEREMALVEAIATWTEQVRDTLAAANGLEHAISATAAVAPAPLAGPVTRLGAHLGYERLSDSLRRFADDIDHPMSDFVVAALITATEKEARDLGALLGHLAESARDEAKMRSRVWVGRARNRSAVRIIVSVVVIFVLGLLAFNRRYLAPYDSAGGQLVLAAVIAMFGASFVMMQRMGRIAMPERFVGRRQTAVTA